MGQDPCVKGKVCNICDGFSEVQRDTLATPSYKIRKEKKAGILMSPKDVTVIGSIDLEEQASQSSAQPSVQPSAHAPAASTSSAPQPVSFVTSAQFEAMNDKWTEQFTLFEALLSRGNVFSTLKMVVPPVSYPVLSDKPFLNPSARPTGLVVYPAEQEVHVQKSETKTKKKSHKSSKGEKVKHETVVTVSENPALFQTSLDRAMIYRNLYFSRCHLPLCRRSGKEIYRLC